MFLKIFALVLCITYVACDEFIRFKPCENITTHSTNVRMKVSECTSEDERCLLHKGKNYTVTILFEPTRDFPSSTEFKVFGIFPKFSVPYGRKANACNASVRTSDGAPCDAAEGFLAGHEYKHVSIFSVSNSYPSIEMGVGFQMRRRRPESHILCIEVQIKIEQPPRPPQSENEA